jgi:hypothetical protein
MFKLLTFSCLIAFTGFLLSGCYPGGAEFNEDLDVVYTNHSATYDFQSKGTYSMPDKIVVDVKIDHGDTIVEYMKDIYAGPILQQIADNMANYGWTRVDISTGPDVLLTPAGISSTTYYYDYWYCWWYGGWYGGWGWYYPPYVTVSSFTTGSLIMTIEDPNTDSPINSSEAVWVSAVNGILSGAYDISRITKGVEQAFKQSTYLKTN